MPTAKNITITSLLPSAASCNQANGALIVNATGGSGALEYSLNGGAYQVSNAFTNLAGGTYTLTVRDQTAGGCIVTQSVSVGGSTTLRIEQIKPTPATCAQANGVLSVTATGGTGALQYSLDGVAFQADNSFANLAGGVYTVTVKDQTTAGCTVTQSATVVSSTAPRIEQVQPTATTCGQSNGALSVTATGGQDVLQYSLDGVAFQASPSFANLAAGPYTITVKGQATATGCTTTQSVTIPGSSPPRIEQIQPAAASCSQANGALSVTATGGTGALQYALDGSTFQASGSFANLAGGVYTVTVKDQATVGCTATQSVTVTSTSAPRIEQIQPTGATCDRANGALSVTATGGAGALQYSLDGLTFQTSNTFTNLSGGAYILSVRDQVTAGCTVTQSVIIASSTAPRIEQIQPTPASCDQINGVLLVTATGGTGALQYSVDGVLFQASPSFANLAGGVYTVTVKDQTTTGCTATQSVTVSSSSAPRIGQVQSTATSCGQASGTLSVTATGGIGTLAYSLDGVLFQAAGSFTNLEAGAYTISVKDGSGCLVRSDGLVSAGGCQVYIPDAFSPNEDGLNDSFRFICGQNISIRQLVIFNRWGEVIFERKNFFIQDAADVWWTGKTPDGKYALPGVYTYQAEYLDQTNGVTVLRGKVQLIR